MRVRRPAVGPVFRSFKAAGWPLAAAALTLWVTAGTAPPPAHAGGPPGTGPSETSGPRGGDWGTSGNIGGGGGGASSGGGGGYSGGGNSGGGNSGGSGGGNSGDSGGNPGSGSGSGGSTPSYHGGGNGHNGNGHNGNGHNGNGHHGGDHPGGGGGHGHGGYRYPTYWGSVFFGWPYPYWYYGPWGFYYEDDYYGNYRNREREQGALDLDLSPADTQVYLNGQYIGIVDNFDGWPQYLWLDPGTYDVVFYREGYKTLARQVTIYRGLVIDWDDKLEKGPSIRPEDLPTKTHERRDARVEQDREMSERHEVREERRVERRDEPSQEAAGRSAGRLRLTVEPHDASVYLDGRFLGTGDDVSRGSGLWVEPGPHTLSVVRPGRRAEEQRFELKPGGEVELKIELKSE